MKVFIADDSAIIRAGLASIFARLHHEVVGEAASAPELVAKVPELMARAPQGTAIDVVVTDVRMPPNGKDDGLRAAVTLRKAFPTLPIMVLSQYVAPAYAAVLFGPQSTAGGGLGYLLKDRVSKIAPFMQAIELVANGGVVVDPQVAASLLRARHGALDRLTQREREVLELMAQGLSNAEISARLVLSGAAVAKHVANVFAKLDLQPGEDNRRVRAVLAYLTATGAHPLAD